MKAKAEVRKTITQQMLSGTLWIMRLLRATLHASAFFLLPCAALAQAVVVGQGNPSIDVPAVQAAVDQGGSVLLVGTFDFGDTGRVVLSKDVAISGEADSSGAPTTTVIGGDWTFFSPLPATLPPSEAGPKIRIQSIHFRQPLGPPIHLAYCGGANIRGNKVTEIRKRPFTTFFRRAGVLIGPRDAAVTTTIFRHLVTGSIKVTDNEVDLAGPDPTITSGEGIFVNLTDGAEVYVARNTVTNCTRNCVDILDNRLDSEGRGSVVIENNTLITGVTGIPIPTPGTPNGIVTGFNFNPALMNDPAAVAPILVSDNHVEVRGQEFSGSSGIVVLAGFSHVEGNTIVINSATGIGIGVLIRGTDGAVLRNRILGGGVNAIRFDAPAGLFTGAINTVAVGNNISGFAASQADYLFRAGSRGNIVVGNSGTALDLGTNNRATGQAPVKGGVGDDVSDAVGPWSD